MNSTVARGLAALAFSVFAGHCAAVSPAVAAASIQDSTRVFGTTVPGAACLPVERP